MNGGGFNRIVLETNSNIKIKDGLP
jgi:hypothetical protein